MKFLSKVAITSGFVASLHLLTGLLARHEENWQKLGEEYGRSVISPGDPFRYESIRRTQATIWALWMVWGPSIRLCTCPEWDGDVLLQYGVVDENNSISLRCSSPEVLRGLSSGEPDMSRGLAFPARVIGTLKWGPSLNTSGICPAQQAIWYDDRLVLDTAEIGGGIRRGGGTTEQVYARFYSAYLWIAFAMCNSEDGEPVYPEQKWRDLVPFFGHGNVADGGTYDFQIGQLACAAFEGALQLLRADTRLALRFVCAVDESGCGYDVLHPAAMPTIRQKMIRMVSDSRGCEPASERLILGFDRQRPWKDGDYSACALPEILKEYYEATGSEESQMTWVRELRIGNPADAELLKKFYEGCYTAEFPDVNERESLENIENYLRQKEAGGYGRNNYHVLVAVEECEPIGGSISDYFVESNAGVIEFLLIKPGLRRTGLGHRLLIETERVLELDAENSLRRRIDWIVGEIEDPYLTPIREGEFDLFARARIWDRWGYRMLDFPYVQPALSAEKTPVYGLKLMAKPCTARFRDSVPAANICVLLQDYLRLAMRIPEPKADAEFRNMERYLSGRKAIALVPFSDHIGWSKRSHVDVNEVFGVEDPELDRALDVYREIFTDPGTAVDSGQFRALFRPEVADRLRHSRYHLWTIRPEGAAACEGMASFFTLPSAGFGGYLGFTAALRGKGRVRHLLRRMEERMVRDNAAVRGWYIECAGEPERTIFIGYGFRELKVSYRQPPLSGAVADRPIHLLYKRFGAVYEPPTIEVSVFLRAVREIYHTVYGIPAAEVETNSLYVELQRSLQGTTAVRAVEAAS